MTNRIVAIIPARLKSKRYPRKPLIKIKGISMVEHVRRRALASKAFEDVYVATCDSEIKNEIKKNGGKVIMTSKKHKLATTRVAEAAKKIKCSHVVNIQGDEPLILPNDLKIVAKEIKKNPKIKYWNAVGNVSKAELLSHDVVKCVVNKSNKIVICSRFFSPIKKINGIKIKKLLGVLAYTKKALLNYIKLKKTNTELFQSIDQSRIIENNIILKSINLKNSFIGINTKAEEKIVMNIISKSKVQKKIFKQLK